MRARLARVAELIEASPARYTSPQQGSAFVIVRAFVKKTEKTPAGEIELALERAKELKR